LTGEGAYLDEDFGGVNSTATIDEIQSVFLSSSTCGNVGPGGDDDDDDDDHEARTEEEGTTKEWPR
jgi:hypothetical protein